MSMTDEENHPVVQLEAVVSYLATDKTESILNGEGTWQKLNSRFATVFAG